RLHRGHEGRGVLVAPRRVVAEGVPGPVLEVGHAALRRQDAGAVVDPVSGERWGADEAAFAPAVGGEHELERRPRDRRLELDEGRTPYPPARRPPRAA